MTTWTAGILISIIARLGRRDETRLARRSGPVSNLRFQGAMKGLVVVKRFKVGVATGKCPIFRIQRNCSLEMRDRLDMFSALSVCDGEHVQSVVVVRILVADEPEMRNGFIVPTAVQCKRRGVQPLLQGLRIGLGRRGVPLADVQIQPDPFMELALIWEGCEETLEQLERAAIIVTLERFETLLIDRDGLGIG
jgi:hypothetical protein